MQWQKEDQCLLGVFTDALKIKVHTLVSNAIFEVIYPISGTLVDCDAVELEKLTTSVPRKNSASGTCVVQLPLAPGLRSHVHQRKLVDYNSFRKPGDDLSGDYVTIVAPLVLEATW